MRTRPTVRQKRSGAFSFLFFQLLNILIADAIRNTNAIHTLRNTYVTQYIRYAIHKLR